MSDLEKRMTVGETCQEKLAAYEPPRVIYEGRISTRAGSPTLSGVPGSDPSISPEDLFSKP